MVKPDGVQRGIVGEVIKRFEAKGFRLVALKMTSVSVSAHCCLCVAIVTSSLEYSAQLSDVVLSTAAFTTREQEHPPFRM